MLGKMKRLLRLRNKGGFTLVEVVISCALLGILMAGVLGFVTPVLSSVRQKEQNARAVLLAEAIDSYIASKIQYAFYVQTFSECASVDTDAATTEPNVLKLKYEGTEFQKQQGKGLTDMLNCLKNDLAGEVFELKCIGVRWTEVPGSGGQKKLMVTNEKVDQVTGRLYPDEAELVFSPIFYDGLYPIIRFENYSNQYQVKDSSGNLVDALTPDKVDIAPGLKIITDVYLDDSVYNTDSNVRNSAMMTWEGVIYTEFNNIKSNLLNSGVYKIQPKISAHTTTDADGNKVGHYTGAFTADQSNAYVGDDGTSTYYSPNSFIYYIARKTKAGKDPDTSAPSSSSSTSEPDPTPAP